MNRNDGAGNNLTPAASSSPPRDCASNSGPFRAVSARRMRARAFDEIRDRCGRRAVDNRRHRDAVLERGADRFLLPGPLRARARFVVDAPPPPSAHRLKSRYLHHLKRLHQLVRIDVLALLQLARIVLGQRVQPLGQKTQRGLLSRPFALRSRRRPASIARPSDAPAPRARRNAAGATRADAATPPWRPGRRAGREAEQWRRKGCRMTRNIRLILCDGARANTPRTGFAPFATAPVP